ncbi:MAG: BatD family protein [Bacteroidota bacterium]
MRLFLSCVFVTSFTLVSLSQDVSISYNAQEVAVNQMFTITVSVANERLRNYSPFPEIEGFLKRGTSSSTSTSFVNGKMTSKQSITQNYQPTQEGTFVVPPFKITINGKEFSSDGFTVKVGPAAQQRRRQDAYDPFDFFNNRQRSTEPQEFVNVEAEAFLALSTDKSEVYVGEGFTTTLAFYVAETNRADMRFYDLGKQITEIVKEIKPANTWEENFNIDNINGQPVSIQGKPYTQYKIFQAAYYPLNVDDIDFPSVGLKLIKYRVAKNPTFFGRNRQEDYETFHSRPKTVKVLRLPPHPLNESVAVGQFVLDESISSEQLETTQSFEYKFTLRGRGNISALEAPRIPENPNFDFYEPNIQQDIRRAQNVVSGVKTFSYYGIPNEPGTFPLGDIMRWIYFDPEREVYDTLRSELTVQVTGESRKNEYISSNDLGKFYDRIPFEDNQLRAVDSVPWWRYTANVVMATIILLSAVMLLKPQNWFS